jgi:hypothetical protein
MFLYFLTKNVVLHISNILHKILHPLSLLTAEGNGAGGGDYRGSNEIIVGSWARDVISIDEEIPENYTELICKFNE